MEKILAYLLKLILTYININLLEENIEILSYYFRESYTDMLIILRVLLYINTCLVIH